MSECKATILIVDDEASIRETYRIILGPKYKYFYAENAYQATQEIKLRVHSLILLDLNMPGESGITLLPIIKEYNPDTAVIIVTATGSYEASLEAMKYSIDGFIEKDFSPLEFHTLVENALKKRKKNILLRSIERELQLDKNFYPKNKKSSHALPKPPTINEPQLSTEQSSNISTFQPSQDQKLIKKHLISIVLAFQREDNLVLNSLFLYLKLRIMKIAEIHNHL